MGNITGTLTQNAEGDYKWEIDGFTSLKVGGPWYGSPDFSCAGGDWRLCIRRISPERGRSEQDVHLCLFRHGGGPPTLDMNYTFSVQDRNGHKQGERRNRMEFEIGDEGPWIPIELQDERMPECVPGNTLTVLCHLERIDPDRVADAVQLKEQQLQQKTAELAEKQSELVRLQRLNEELNLKVADIEADREKLQKLLETKSADCDSGSTLLQKNKVLRDLKDLFHKKKECDVVLKVQGQEFPALKAILTARSPVFASIFQSDMKEKATGVVEIEDCDPSSFSDFLCYLYCGVMENLSPENVFNLFTAADKYDVQDMRSECLEFVKENLSVDTFCDTITLALLHSETELTELCTDFFVKNATRIITTVEWQKFNAEHPTYGNELFIKFATSVGSSKE